MDRSPQRFVRDRLLGYPTLYKSPKDVLISAFTTVGQHLFWDKDGNLSDPYQKDVEVFMSFDDLDQRDKDNAERDTEVRYASLYTVHRLRIAKERGDRKFIADNIDDLVNHCLHESLSFGAERKAHYTESLWGMEHYPAFTFPDNINPEWAKVLCKFLDNWLPDLAGVYMYAPHVKGSTWQDWIADWPEDVKKLYASIRENRVRIHSAAFNGQTYEQYADNAKKISEMMMKALDEVLPEQ